VQIKDTGDEFIVFEDGQEVGRAPGRVKMPHIHWQGSVISGTNSIIALF
jgi:hypothetical protein